MADDPSPANSQRALQARGVWSEPASSHGRPAAASASEADINRMLFEAQVSAIPDALPMWPWETGLFKNIFQDNMGVDAPVFKMPVPLAVSETIRD